MKLTSISLLIAFLILSKSHKAQLSGHYTDESWLIGFNVGLSSIKNNTLLYEEGRKVGPYLGFGMDFSYQSYLPGSIRYHLEAKWVNDLMFKAVELFRGVGTDPRLDLTGFTWHKIGINVIGTDNFCLGIGGSFSDYIVDIPKWTVDGYYQGGSDWQEPSGWHWTAGPCLFVDYGVGDFTFNLITSYDIRYFHPKVTDDYESLIDAIDGYKAPSFVFTDFSINHDSGVYLSFDRVRMIDKGILENQMKRNSLQLGWKWWI